MLTTKARSWANVWLVDNAKGQIKAKQTEIKTEKEQTVNERIDLE